MVFSKRIEAIRRRVEDMKPLWNKMQSVDDLRFLLEVVDILQQSQKLTVKFKKLRDDAIVPRYQTPGAAGFDFHALAEGVLLPREHAVIPTGIAVELPPGYVLLLFARSGNAMRYGITLSNGVGVCDQDYRGEIKALLYNAGHHPFRIEKGDRIMQGVIVPYVKAEFVEVAELGETERGEGGFGSTGAK